MRGDAEVTSRGPVDWNEDPLDDLARSLRESVGSEFRIEAEITEQETEIGRLRKRSMADSARELANRGDTVSLVLTGRTMTGRVVHVGRDYLTMHTSGEIVDTRLDAAVIEVHPSTEGGTEVSGGSITFRARLTEFEQTGERVTLVAGSIPHTVVGVIRVVAADHVIVSDLDHNRVLVPTERIDLVLRSIRRD